MPCIQTQYGTLLQSGGPCERYPADLLTPELGKSTMDLMNTEITAATTSLPSFSTFMDNYTGEFDAFLYQIPAANPTTASFKLEDFQVYGCYPGSFSSQLDETLSSSGSDYYGSPCSVPSPSTPTFQTSQGPSWENSFGAYSPPHTYEGMRPWVAGATTTEPPKTGSGHPSYFSFGPSAHSPGIPPQSPLKMQSAAHQHLVDGDVFSLPQTSPSVSFSPLPLNQASPVLDSPSLMDNSLSPTKARSPGSNEGRCAVCGDNASCQHYGVRTCEGCKGFFKVSRGLSFLTSCPVLSGSAFGVLKWWDTIRGIAHRNLGTNTKTFEASRSAGKVLMLTAVELSHRTFSLSCLIKALFVEDIIPLTMGT